MEIDIRTIIVIIGIVHLMQVLIFTYQYNTNKTISGPGWWLMWSAAEFLGFGLLLLRGNPTLLPIVIVFQNVIILTGTIFVYIGVFRFFDKKVNLKFVLSFFVSFVLLHLFFFFVNDNINIRTLVFDVWLSIIAFLTAKTLYQNRTRSIASTAIFNTSIFVIHGAIFAYRSVMILSGTTVEEVFTPSLFNLAQYFDALIVGLLWTFGFIIMLNQRLNSEIIEAKSHFEKIFNTSPDAVMITRLSDGMFVDCNEGYTKITGYTKVDNFGKSSLDINLWNNPEDRFKIVRMLQDKGFCENFELLFRKKDGELMTGLMSARIIQLNGLPHIISVTRDISGRKKLEVDLQKSEQRLQFVLQGSQLGYWDWDFKTNEVKRNERWAEMLGYNLDDVEFTIQQWIDFVHPDDRSIALESVQNHLDGTTKMHQAVYRMRAKTGNYIWILDQAQAVAWDLDMNVIRMCGTHTDITERVQAENEVKQKNEELQKINAEKDKFFSIIAHDLRSPFNGFLGLTQILVEELPILTMDEIQNYSVSMRKSAANLFRLLENLLDWARMKQGLIPFEPKLTELLPLVTESIAMTLEPAKSKNIGIDCDIPVDFNIFADSNMLQTVIRNLVSNAVKFTPMGGKVSISAKKNRNRGVEIAVCDTGIGMSPEMIGHLFRIDVQTNRKGTENEPSTGLGLLLCKEFIEKHGGKLWVESEVGKGSTFYCTFPILRLLDSDII